MDPKKKQNKNKRNRKLPETNSRSRILFLYTVAIFAFSFLLYGNTLHHSYALDDAIVSKEMSMFSRDSVGSPSSFQKDPWQDLTMLMKVPTGRWPCWQWQLKLASGGKIRAPIIFFNVLYFAISCVLLLFLLRRLFANSPRFFRFLLYSFLRHTLSIPKPLPTSKAATKYWISCFLPECCSPSSGINRYKEMDLFRVVALFSLPRTAFQRAGGYFSFV